MVRVVGASVPVTC